MSADPHPSPEDEGVRAFLAMSESLDRAREVFARAEAAQREMLGEQNRAAGAAMQAAGQAHRAATGALEAARAARWPFMAWAALAALLGVLAGLGGGFLLGRSNGWHTGLTAGYAAARDEQAATHWANSPGGRNARALEAAGSLTQLITCGSPGWQVTTQDGRRMCSPNPTRNGQYGWFLPDR